jgi:hypothetical protein
MQQNYQVPMNTFMYPGFNPNMDYGPMPQIPSNDPRYLDLEQKYKTLLRMYRSRPLVKQVKAQFPRNVGMRYRLPVLQQQYPGTLRNLEKYANRLNLQFNPGDLTNTTEFMRENSLGKSTEDQYYELKRELGMGGSNRKKSKKIKRKKTAMGGKSKRKGKKSNYTKKRK